MHTPKTYVDTCIDDMVRNEGFTRGSKEGNGGFIRKSTVVSIWRPGVRLEIAGPGVESLDILELVLQLAKHDPAVFGR